MLESCRLVCEVVDKNMLSRVVVDSKGVWLGYFVTAEERAGTFVEENAGALEKVAEFDTTGVFGEVVVGDAPVPIGTFCRNNCKPTSILVADDVDTIIKARLHKHVMTPKLDFMTEVVYLANRSIKPEAFIPTSPRVQRSVDNEDSSKRKMCLGTN